MFFETKFIKLMIYLHGIWKRGDNLLPKYHEVITDIHCSYYNKEHEHVILGQCSTVKTKTRTETVNS